MRKLLFVLLLMASLISCSKKCRCSESFDGTKTYVKGDVVAYKGKCYKAQNQGRGITPGPWMQNGNDIWEECTAR